MAVVQSLGALVDVRGGGWQATASYGSLTLYDQVSKDYAALYRNQPNIRTCVDFLARNIAQLGLHVFRRVNETDRERLRDHPLATLIGQPLPEEFKLTRYRLIERLVADLGIYFNAFWLKVRTNDAEAPVGLLPISPRYVSVKGGLLPTGYEVSAGSEPMDVPLDQMVHFRGYSASSAVVGLSPLETLRRVLAEEQAAGDYREYFWRNAARQSGVITRPKDAPEWSDLARQRFKQEWAQLYTGTANSGKTAVLEEGMDWKAMTFSAQEAEYLAGRKLTREECARAYHIPLPMVGILDHATFSNIREQHKNLYQDALGPWLRMIEEDIDLQLLPEFDDSQGVYCEFNIQEKLAGAFEEQTQALQSAVGRPWMTANEARARMNMPSLAGDADRLVTPLNVLVGAQASPRDVDGRGSGGLAGESLGLVDIIAASVKAALVEYGPAAGRNGGNGGYGGVNRAEQVDIHGYSRQLMIDGQRLGLGDKADGKVDPTLPTARVRWEEKWRQEIARTFRRQQDAVLGKVPEKRHPAAAVAQPASAASAASRKQVISTDELWDLARWNRELAKDLARLNTATALVWAQYVAETMGIELDEDVMVDWLLEHSRIQAEYINGVTRQQIGDALTEDEPRDAVRHVFEVAISARAAQIAVSAVTSAASFGSQEGAKQAGLRWKQWQVNSSNPRPSHAAMNGERVGLRERFSNGGLWPGDPALGADENANCMCSVVFGR